MYVVKFICFFLFLRECHGNKGHIVITSEKKIKSRNMTIKTLGRRKELPAQRRGLRHRGRLNSKKRLGCTSEVGNYEWPRPLESLEAVHSSLDATSFYALSMGFFCQGQIRSTNMNCYSYIF